jgi:uncharacterized protein YggE
MLQLIATLLVALNLVGFLFNPGFADEIVPKRTVSVMGTGVASAQPDIASISIGVVSESETAREALDKNSAAINRVLVELKGQDVAPKDIQTTSFSVQPRYQHFKDGKPPATIGYQVVNAVRIIVRNLEKLGGILDLAVGQGSNQINGIQFMVENADAIEDEARKKAFADAHRRAELFALAGNAKLGQVLQISETATRSPQPVYPRAAIQAREASVPIERGEQQIQAQVRVSWELKD